MIIRIKIRGKWIKQTKKNEWNSNILGRKQTAEQKLTLHLKNLKSFRQRMSSLKTVAEVYLQNLGPGQRGLLITLLGKRLFRSKSN